MSTAYIASRGYEKQLRQELEESGCPFEQINDRFFLSPEAVRPLAWAVNVWLEVERHHIESIGAAAHILRERGPYWSVHAETVSPRRAGLIAKKLLKIKEKINTFPLLKMPKPRGGYTLLDDNTMLCAQQTSRPCADGELLFEEDHENPPSRAYLKLWESLSLLGDLPKPGDKVVELGAAPGAWTWSLASLGCDVHSVDKAPLDEKIDALPNVTHRTCSAFGLDPAEEQADWLFSDIICYPERLLNLIERWMADGYCKRYNITIKFQAETDFDAIRALQKIPGSRLLHLHYNKHEVTWVKHPSFDE